MPNITMYNQDGSAAGEITLADEVFAADINQYAIHQVVVAQQAASRQGTQSALTRSEVRGGGIKPWRQKGTGRARQGSTRSPQWTHGGVVFAPKPRDYRISVNKKVKRLAMKCALSSKVSDGSIIVFDELNIPEAKTKEMIKVLSAVNVENALVVLPESDATVERATSNIPGVKTTLVGTLNVYEILKYDKLILTKGALDKVEEVCS